MPERNDGDLRTAPAQILAQLKLCFNHTVTTNIERN